MCNLSAEMAASIEHLSMLFVNYPGGIDASDRTKYIFPAIRFYQSSGSVKSWVVYVQGCYGSEVAAHQNEASGKFMSCELAPELFDVDPRHDFYCRIVVTTTIKNPKIESVKLVTRGSNVGRANQKTVFHQALLDAYSAYRTTAKQSRRFVEDSPHLLDTKMNSVVEQARFASRLIPPMLACNLEPEEWYQKYGRGGDIYIQRKLNGTRALCSRFGDVAADPIFYTRKNGVTEPKNLAVELRQLTLTYPDLVFDGEIYTHGLHLQEISGASRKSKTAAAINIEYHIYDLASLDRSFEDRLHELGQIASEVSHCDFRFIKFEPTTRVESFAMAESLYHQFVADGYEGAMLRLGPSMYDPSYNSHRSESICKWKPTYSTEFRCVGWAEGKGNARAMVAMFTCEVTAVSLHNLHGKRLPSPLVIGKQFGCSLSATEQQKRAWFAEFTADPRAFAEQYEGRYCTIEFYDVSRDGVPLQGHWTTFVDGVDEKIDAYVVTDDVDF